MVETALRLGAVCPVSAGLARRLLVGRPGAVVRPLDPPVAVPLHLAWRHPAPAAVHALAETAAGRTAAYAP
jgi:DNA-binding transcriptional LysR family regulator